MYAYSPPPTMQEQLEHVKAVATAGVPILLVLIAGYLLLKKGR